jgi:hypothetical protein
MLLGQSQLTVKGTFLGSTGGWAVGLLLILIALGAAIIYWAYRKGWWRPGLFYGKLMARVRPQVET